MLLTKIIASMENLRVPRRKSKSELCTYVIYHMKSANYWGYVCGQMPKNANVICEGFLSNQKNRYIEFESPKKKVKNRNYVNIRQKRFRDTNTLPSAMKILNPVLIKSKQIKLSLSTLVCTSF